MKLIQSCSIIFMVFSFSLISCDNRYDFITWEKWIKIDSTDQTTEQETPPATQPGIDNESPVPGNKGEITLEICDNYTVLLQWEKADDNITSQDRLLYQVSTEMAYIEITDNRINNEKKTIILNDWSNDYDVCENTYSQMIDLNNYFPLCWEELKKLDFDFYIKVMDQAGNIMDYKSIKHIIIELSE